jgi:hypothetical protein
VCVYAAFGGRRRADEPNFGLGNKVNFGTADAPGRRARVWVLKLLFVSFHRDEASLFVRC